MTELPFSNPFQSFWMGGFECTDQLNSFGNRVDLINTTDHLEKLIDDYLNVRSFNITTVREGIRWSFVERQPYQYNFDIVREMIKTGIAPGIQQVWDICHFGYPDDLNPLHPHFTQRFVSVCKAFVHFHKTEFPGRTLIVTPINEVSFISWLGGEAAGTTPYTTGNGWNIKYALMRAYIQGIRAMKEIDSSIRILTTEPLVNMVPPLFAGEEEIALAATHHNDQFQALDMLGGYICPELGGSPDLLDILGFNFYYNNQWVVGFGEFLPWLNEVEDPRWMPLSTLLINAYNRYEKPIVITETSHPGEDRPLWIDFIATHCSRVLEENVPLWGVCIYPVIDRPDWDNLETWHRSGLWDNGYDDENGKVKRVLNEPYARSFLSAQAKIEPFIHR